MARRRWAVQIRAAIALVALCMWVIWAWRQHQAQRAAAPTTSPATIRIATWNLRKFSDRDAPGQYPPDLVQIASIIKSAQFDLVAIQEVQREGQMVEKLRRQLNEPWRHIVSDRTGNNERYAFIYRGDRVQLKDDSVRLIVDAETAIFDRAPFTATFCAGEFDFTLLTVHLSYANHTRRAAEAAALLSLARRLVDASPEKDLIVLGDFNEQRQRPNLPLFDQQGWMRLNPDATNLSSTEIYDNLLVDRRFTKEWTGLAGTWRFDELDYANQDKQASEFVSDHRPAWAEFVTSGPDDD